MSLETGTGYLQGNPAILNRVVAKRQLLTKFAGWERGHRQLNFGWRTLGKGIEQFFGYVLV